MKHIKLFEDFGELEVDIYEPPSQIQCNKCGWNWNVTNSLDPNGEKKYICPKCGEDNKVFYEGEPEDEDELPPVGAGEDGSQDED
jgi:DNA-directed RNA polymerase subunit RPC12/RpoP